MTLNICPKIHQTTVLYQLHWLPIKARVLYKLLVLTYQAFYGLAPKYLCELVTKYEPTSSLRSADQLMLIVPKTRLITFGDRAFVAAAPKEWNKLPLNIRSIDSVSSFKSQLKTHLFKCNK